jgi:thioredoxin
LSEKTVKLTQENWKSEVEDSPEPVLVDFWAEWCPPCRLVGPIVEALAEEYSGRVKVGKLDVDSEPELAGRFGVRSIPTLLLFREGKVVDQRVGAAPREELARFLDAELTTAKA